MAYRVATQPADRFAAHDGQHLNVHRALPVGGFERRHRSPYLTVRQVPLDALPVGHMYAGN